MENKNSPAFPLDENTSDRIDHVYSGLNKREYFIAKAMQGIIISCYSCAGWTGMDISVMAEASVLLADAVLSEIEKDKP